MRKVTMELTDRDVENVRFLRDIFHFVRSNAQVISIALSITQFLVRALRVEGSDLLIRNPDGSLDRVIMPELAHLSQR
jgi:hypothetical protein